MATNAIVSTKISNEDLKKINDSINTIDSILKPYLSTLTPQERKKLPKMSDKSTPFVKKVLEYLNISNKFTPSYLDVTKLNSNFDSIDDLAKIERSLHQILEGVIDTSIVVGSETYLGSLSYYNSVKQAAKMNIQDAKVIYEDLKVRFKDQGKKLNKT